MKKGCFYNYDRTYTEYFPHDYRPSVRLPGLNSNSSVAISPMKYDKQGYRTDRFSSINKRKNRDAEFLSPSNQIPEEVLEEDKEDMTGKHKDKAPTFSKAV